MSDRRDRITMSREELARALGGEVRGYHVLCPGPNHSPEDRSLSVRVNPDGTWLINSFSPKDSAFECKDYVRKKAGLPAWNGKVVDPATKPNG
jgi:putative DNA primase/helicase